MRLAKYKNLQLDIEVVSQEWPSCGPHYIRVSEYVEVDFPPLPAEAVTALEIHALDCKIQAIQDQAFFDIAQIKQRKQELLALRHEVAA
jgi:hypothetical protein